MIFKITECFKEESRYFKLYDIKGNEIKDQNTLYWLTKIVSSIKYTLDMVDKGLKGYNTIDLEDDMNMYTIYGKVKIYTKILQQLHFNVKFSEIDNEDTMEL